MGIGKLIEEVAGAVAAERAAEALAPNAGVLAQGAAAIGGFVAVEKLNEALDARDAAKNAAQPAPGKPATFLGDDAPPDDGTASNQT